VKKMADYSADELNGLANRGAEARAFYNDTKFFREVVEPAVIEKAKEVKAASRWTPARPVPAADAGMLTAYTTGFEEGLLFLEDFVALCMREADMAVAELKRRQDKAAEQAKGGKK